MLRTGSKLGPFEIERSIGAGGMGEVYRARDGRLGRSVAIKVILESFAADADRIARFEREAKVLASINHPNIAALYGIEQANGQHFLVMELVEGETLAERLQRGPLQIEEALRIVVQIAEALEAAHDKHIIHRDLKPANIKLTPDDKVKVLDFGLAKSLDAAPAGDVANSPTLSMLATNAGIILGTAAYMSPEQAKGLPADHRSDVFSLGVVLYEMLTGRQPFQGETAPDVLASVLVREPELHRLPTDINPRLTELIRRCLEKNPKRRWQAIGDLRAEIEGIASSPRALTSQAPLAGPPKPLWRRALPIGLASLVSAIVAAVVVWQVRPLPTRDITRFSFGLPDDQPLTAIAREVLDISPDGKNVIYAANGRFYLRPMSSLTATPLQGSENQQNSYSPSFSPDGQQVAFYTMDGSIKRAAVAGGPAVTICSVPDNPGGPYWINWVGDSIVFSVAEGVMRVADKGGTPEKIVSHSSDERVQRVQVLPGGETILMTVVPSAVSADRWGNAQIVVQSLKSGDRKVLLKGASDGWYISSGHLAYVIGGTLYAIEFDLAHLETKGAAAPIIEGVRRSSLASSGVAWFSVSRTGPIVYMPGPASGASTLFDVALIDQKGSVAALKLPPAPYEYPRASPDGKRLGIGTDDGKDAVVWVYELSRAAAPQRLTFEGRNRFPVWTSDSKRAVFQSDRGGDRGIYWQTADGTSDAERLTTAAAGESHIPESWHPRGDVMLFSVANGREYSLWMYSVSDKKATPFGDVRSSVPIDAVFSPEGKWVAYSNASVGNTSTIYLQPFPPTRAKYEVPRVGRAQPHHPVWSPDGRSLIHNAHAGFLDVVSIMSSPTVAFGNSISGPRKFQTGPPNVRRAFDVMPDGRLVGLIAPEDPDGISRAPQVNVVLNWLEELKARVSAR